MSSTPCEHPPWLDFDALDRYIARWIDSQDDADLRAALIAAVERSDAEIVYHSDTAGAGEWVGVRIMGMRLGRVHRSRVQRAGAN